MLLSKIIKVFIVLREEYRGKITEDKIIDWTKDKLAAYKYPRIVQFIRSIPKTPIG